MRQASCFRCNGCNDACLKNTWRFVSYNNNNWISVLATCNKQQFLFFYVIVVDRAEKGWDQSQSKREERRRRQGHTTSQGSLKTGTEASYSWAQRMVEAQGQEQAQERGQGSVAAQ